MHYLFLTLISFVALVLQPALFSRLELAGVHPDLLFVLVVFFALLNGRWPGAVYGYLMGLAQDILTAKFLGFQALALGLTGYLVGITEGKIFKDNLVVPVVAVSLATLLYHWFLAAEALALGIGGLFERLSWGDLVILMGYNSVLTVLIYGRYYRSHTYGWLKK